MKLPLRWWICSLAGLSLIHVSAGSSQFFHGADTMVFAGHTANITLQYVPVQLLEQRVAELHRYLQSHINRLNENKFFYLKKV